MPNASPPRNFGWQRYWFTLEHEIQSYYDNTKSNPRVLRQGEIAYAEGVFTTDFWDFLLRKGYRLTEDERWTIVQASKREFSTKGKPVVIIKRLGGGRYVVCRMSSWGGKFQVADLLSPVQRYFAFAMSGFIDEWPPGTKPLLSSPPVRKGQAIMTIPMERNDVAPIAWYLRTFLSIGELERLETMIRQREKSFHLVSDKLRESEVRIIRFKTLPFHKWPRAMREGFKKSDDSIVHDPNTIWNQILPVHLRVLSDRLRLHRRSDEELMKYRDKNAPRLRVPQSTNLIQWTFQRTVDEFVNCDIFMDPAKPGINVEYFRERYRVPRVAAGRKEATPLGANPRNPFEKRQKQPVARSVRTFCTIARFSKIIGRSHLPPITFR